MSTEEQADDAGPNGSGLSAELGAGAEARCWCHKCNLDAWPFTLKMIVCPDCGNKRCPRANDHRNACTDSNAPNQPGSAYTVEPGRLMSDAESAAWLAVLLDAPNATLSRPAGALGVSK
jgi:hypothetical protein